MRKTIIAIALGLTAIAAAACNTPGNSVDSIAPLESVGLESLEPLESVDPLASPSDALESPASS